jgi:hypothetical protein
VERGIQEHFDEPPDLRRRRDLLTSIPNRRDDCWSVAGGDS